MNHVVEFAWFSGLLGGVGAVTLGVSIEAVLDGRAEFAAIIVASALALVGSGLLLYSVL